jgi:glycosyltransferase involved in cell wall biosynthesis
MHPFAYLFERFPSFVQTFVYREVREMVRQAMNPLVVSIRQLEDAPDLAEPLDFPITYLPPEKELRAEIDRRLAARSLPGRVRRALKEHRQERDSQRLFEAAYLGPLLKERGIRHVHAHFGGMATRTAWWLRELYGITYSFTGHANDIFCEHGTPLTNRALVERAKLVITETDFARHWVEEHHPGAGGKVVRIFNGISMPEPARPDPAAIPRILSVGRYVEKKGFGDLIESCRLLRERGHAFECIIVGGGPLHQELQAQIERLALGDCVKLAGPQAQSDVAALLSTAHLFVLACVVEKDGGSDNLPTVVAEAMAAGVPTISTTVAGVPEMITHGRDGLLVAPHEPAQLADAVERLLRDPGLRQRLGAAGRETAGQKFAIERTTSELKHLLVRHLHLPVPAAARAVDPTLKPTWRSRCW